MKARTTETAVVAEPEVQAPSRDGTAIAIASLVGAATIWGTATIGTKSALDTYPPFILASVRWMIALSVMTPTLLLRGGKPILDRRTALLGLCGITLFNLFFNFGLQRTSAANGSLISGALPVVIAFFAFLLFRERLGPIAVVGIALSIAGIVATVLGDSLDASLSGNLLIFGSVIVWALFSIYSRHYMQGEDAMAATMGTAVWGLLFMLPFAGQEFVTGDIAWPSLKVAAVVVYLGLGPSMAGILLWSFGLTRIPATQAGVFSNLTPIVGIAAAGIVLSEPITRYHIVGTILVLSGVLLTTWSRSRSLR